MAAPDAGLGRAVATAEDRLALVADEVRGYLEHHAEQRGERAEHLSVPVVIRDLEDWLAALADAETRAARDGARLARCEFALVEERAKVLWYAAEANEIRPDDRYITAWHEADKRLRDMFLADARARLAREHMVLNDAARAGVGERLPEPGLTEGHLMSAEAKQRFGWPFNAPTGADEEDDAARPGSGQGSPHADE